MRMWKESGVFDLKLKLTMNQDLFVFVRSFKERFDELSHILNSGLKAADIKQEWSTFIEFTIEPVGWRAIWKISRDLCTDLKIDYPCTVIVTVQDTNFKELSCTVTINEVEDENVCLPPMMADVPLVELYPTIEQDNNFVLSKLFETAKVIDCLRFFYNYLWMPWDEDFDEFNTWVATHLEGRLKLHFALLERQVPSEVAYSVRKLVAEGRKIKKEIEDIQEQMSEEMEVDGFANRLLELTELHNRMSGLRDQYQIYEKPELLQAYVQRAQNIEKNLLENENCESVNYVVLETCTPEQLKRLAKMTSEYKRLRVSQTVEEVLVRAPSGAVVSVLQGTHPVHDLGNFETGGTIRGLEPGAVLTEDADHPAGWSLLRGSLTLANLTVRMAAVWDIIKVRPGAECVLRDVRLEGARITDALDVFPRAKLTATNCHFSHCRTAVVCDVDSTVQLTNCTFDSNNIAVEVKEGCNFTMGNCTISNSKTFGINLVVGKHGTNALRGINSIPGLKESGTTYNINAMDLHVDSSAAKPADSENSGGDILSASR